VSVLWPQAADVFVQVSPAQMQLLMALEDQSFLVPGHLYINNINWFVDGRFAHELILRDQLMGFRQAYSFGLGLPLESPWREPEIYDVPGVPTPGPRSVLIAPHANFTRNIPAPFWAALAKGFVAAGYEVYLDAFGCDPVDAHGVTNIQASVLQFLTLARRCSSVVMLRSGLSDLVSAFSHSVPEQHLMILWHMDPSTHGTLYEEWHSAGCSVGHMSSKTWFGCGGNVIDIEVDPKAEPWLSNPAAQLLRHVPQRVAAPSVPAADVAAPAPVAALV
jgi:hypothetical protein